MSCGVKSKASVALLGLSVAVQNIVRWAVRGMAVHDRLWQYRIRSGWAQAARAQQAAHGAIWVETEGST